MACWGVWREKSITTNVRATGSLIPMIAPLLQAAQGRALFLDDPRAGQKFFGAYGATKAAQIALAKSWAAESIKTGPQVFIETPPPMPTATRARFYPGESRAQLVSTKIAASQILDRVLA